MNHATEQWNTFINIIFLIVISLLYIMRSRHLSDSIHQESFSMMYNPINQVVVASILFAIMKDMKIIGDKPNGLIIDGKFCYDRSTCYDYVRHVWSLLLIRYDGAFLKIIIE